MKIGNRYSREYTPWDPNKEISKVVYFIVPKNRASTDAIKTIASTISYEPKKGCNKISCQMLHHCWTSKLEDEMAHHRAGDHDDPKRAITRIRIIIQLRGKECLVEGQNKQNRD